MNCPFCNNIINDNAKFCKYCGNNTENASTAQGVTVKNYIEQTRVVPCPNCGKALPEQAVFCTNCGVSLNGGKILGNVFVRDNLPKQEPLKQQKTRRKVNGWSVVICVLLFIIAGSAVAIIGLAGVSFCKKNAIVRQFVESKKMEEVNEKENTYDGDKESGVVEQSDENRLEEGTETLNANDEYIKDDEEQEKDNDDWNTENEIIKGDEEQEETSSLEQENDLEDIPKIKISMSKIQTVRSSSELSEYNMTHSADRVVDGNVKTAWVEGVAGYGAGENVTFEFDDTYCVKGLNIHAGYHKEKSLYEKNSRPKKIVLEFSDGTKETHTLKDVMKKQRIVFEKERLTTSVKITIKEVYAGNKYKDTVISEVSFY